MRSFGHHAPDAPNEVIYCLGLGSTLTVIEYQQMSYCTIYALYLPVIALASRRAMALYIRVDDSNRSILTVEKADYNIGQHTYLFLNINQKLTLLRTSQYPAGEFVFCEAVDRL